MSAEASEAPEEAEVVDVADHRSGKPPVPEGLEVLFDGVPEGASVIKVTEGVLWARLPLPWSLDHINVYLFEEADGWTVVDTGSNGDTGRECWDQIIETKLGGKPITRVIATHMHPDHIGLAGWLVEKTGAEFITTQGEFLLANTLWKGASDEFPEFEPDFLLKNGLNPKYEEMVRSAGYSSYSRGVYKLPPTYRRIEDGSEIMIGGRNWRVLIGRGHSPEHACLACLDEPLFIGGDQVLPEITSNVSVHAREPMSNPLALWITSLERMRAVKNDPIVLPSHGPVFKGLDVRLDGLIESHLNKLGRLHTHMTEPMRPTKTFPALFRRKITGFDFFLALGEAIAHLHLLESLDLAERTEKDGVYHFEAKGEYDASKVIERLFEMPGVALTPLKAI